MKIFDYFKSLLPSIKKDTLVSSIELSKKELETIVLPLIDSLEVEKLRNKEAKKIVTQLTRGYKGPRTSDWKSLLRTAVEMSVSKLTYLSDVVDSDFNRDSIKEGLNVKKTIVIRSIDHISFISQFTMDLINYINVHETTSYNGEIEFKLSPHKEKYILGNMDVYIKLISTYSMKNTDFIKKVDNLPDVVIGNGSTITANIYSESNIDPILGGYYAGFNYSPILAVRMSLAEWSANRYKTMIDKKKVLEMQILYLKSLRDGNNNPKLEQQIEYQQSRVDSMEYKLEKMEDSVGGL